MKAVRPGIKKASPGRCLRCGCLMVMVRLQDRRIAGLEGEPQRLVGWQCLICGKVVDLHSLVHRHEQLERDASRRFRQRERAVPYG